MKFLLSIILLFSFEASAQWNTTTVGAGGTIPEGVGNQFIIDPYRNDIWLVNDFGASVIKNDGTLKTYRTNELGSLWGGSELKFAFTQDHIYYIRELIGLYGFDNETPQNLFSSQVIEKVFTDQDTVFIYDGGGDSFSHITGVSTTPLWLPTPQNFISKNGKRYGHSGGTLFYILTIFDVTSFATDVPGYLISPANTFSFSRYSDTLYVGQEAGISVIYEDTIVDSIVSTNTINMPSSNILDIQFDMNDNLWAVFGDTNDDAFVLAKLEGNTWTNIYDDLNSPIDFETYKGVEFDTLNNIWVVDSYGLHTLENVNSPSWLGFSESDMISFSVFPNPSSGTVSVQTEANVSDIEIHDLTGRLVQSMPFTSEIQIGEKGTYIIRLLDKGVLAGTQKVVIE